MRRQPFPVAGALDDYLVAGVGQPVQGAVPQDRVVKDAQPFLHGPVAGDDEAGGPVPVDDQLIEVCRLLGGEPVQPQVVKDEQVRGQEGPEGAVHGVVHPGLGHGPEEVVRVDEAAGASGFRQGQTGQRQNVCKIVPTPQALFCTDPDTLGKTLHHSLIKRLLADTCELCGSTVHVEVHHVRALSDLNVKGQRKKPLRIQIMAARRRKTLVVCSPCHLTIHGGDWQPRKQQ